METVTAKCIKCGMVGPHKIYLARENTKDDKYLPIECESCEKQWEIPDDPTQRAGFIIKHIGTSD